MVLSAVAELWFSGLLLLLFYFKHCAMVNIYIANLTTRNFSVLDDEGVGLPLAAVCGLGG